MTRTPEIDYKLELGRLPDWEIGRFLTLEDATGCRRRPGGTHHSSWFRSSSARQQQHIRDRRAA
jgi:hypothetical protein